MSKENGIILAGVQLVLFILLAGALVAKGGLYIKQHEGDTLHLLQILMRMGEGQLPHLDFVTPIGILAFLPIVAFTNVGFDVGLAFISGQILVAAIFLPAIWYVSITRLTGPWRYFFMVAMMIMCLGLIHGETKTALSVSMHYNRWAWAAAFLAIVTAVLPKRTGQGELADGMIVGLGFAAMAMIKVTYFAAFLPAVLVALFTRGAGKTVLWALIVGLVAVGAMTAYVGTPKFWLFYLADLLNVSGSSVRPHPGRSFSEVVSSPIYLPNTMLGLAGVILLRQAGRMREGLVLLLLLPGFFYVTYQNFGNDPQWTGLLAILLIMLVPDRPVYNGVGWDVSRGLVITASCAFVLAAPSFFNIAQSPFRHLVTKPEDYVPLLQGVEGFEDLQAFDVRAHRLDAKRALDGPDTVFAAYHDPEARENGEVTFQGEALPWCSLELGMVAWFRTVSDDLVATGLVEGKSLFVADLLPSYWMYGAGEPVPGGSPWYYGGLKGIKNADLLLVPLCPLSLDVRKTILDEVSEKNWVSGVREVRRTPEYILYRLPADAE
ncbi:hypothetical protein O2N63_07930 [Aliiroseovarius sp. KMU-50]|uniref:DUF2029 domain-containing protein n=1 Tax=Aliiroseovarius salicola TaxID=3009082 RepID=A0ABT4W0I4_9RHOB|nr:hypothetical protein [Aliiroseovarius sp. KMU-50]MDA5094016.1 hypothetical protein [Aliiroseovarius sp. KMU-50]